MLYFISQRAKLDKKRDYSARVIRKSQGRTVFGACKGPAGRIEPVTDKNGLRVLPLRDALSCPFPPVPSRKAGKRLAERGIVLAAKYSSTCRRVLKYSPQSTLTGSARPDGASGKGRGRRVAVGHMPAGRPGMAVRAPAACGRGRRNRGCPRAVREESC